jgi:hypothetical protein
MDSPPTFRRLLTGLDTVQAVYFLRPTPGGEFRFDALMAAKESPSSLPACADGALSLPATAHWLSGVPPMKLYYHPASTTSRPVMMYIADNGV